MLKRLGIVVAVAGVGALAVSSAGPATGGDPAGGGDHRHTVRVISTAVGEAFIDVGRRGESLGDSFVFNARLNREGKKIGHVGVVCTITSVQREEAQCLGTAKLPRGQVSVQGLVRGEREVFSFPITGGTGAFDAAGGTLEVHTLSNTRERLVFRIVH